MSNNSYTYDPVCIGSGPAGQCAAIQAAKLGKIIRTVFNYPTLAECYKVAAFNAANELALVRSAGMTQETAIAVDP